MTFILDHRAAIFVNLAVAVLIAWWLLESAGVQAVVRIYRRADGPGAYGLTILAALGLAASFVVFGAAFFFIIGLLSVILLPS
ncbi:MAG: hypothetical protein P4L85_29435 [Paludisphaera borealis]|uniref:hypothetical protein n=1 Tax=Paludisphaera borealis TaxID=1387353 RepID=UPI00284C3E70|nr:hypothetical protein [Paludisphaera borealis]MDR3623492.1 hypothetical protein [Paludisphaera borealis]